MTRRSPAAFVMLFTGTDGAYTIRFRPTDNWQGLIDVTIRRTTMRWDVLHAEFEADGSVVLSGMMSGSQALWADEFWLQLRLGDQPTIIRYWGDRIVWRRDRSVALNDLFQILVDT